MALAAAEAEVEVAVAGAVLAVLAFLEGAEVRQEASCGDLKGGRGAACALVFWLPDLEQSRSPDGRWLFVVLS